MYRLVIVLALIIISCSSTKTTGKSEEVLIDKSVEANQGELSILNMIQRLPGVTVRGSGNNVSIRVFAGPQTYGSSSEPLFLVDGKDNNFSYYDIENNINVNDVKRVEVYKTPSELSMYGSRGANGAINIILKD